MYVCEHVCEQPDLQPYAQSVSSYPRPAEAMRAEHNHPAKSKAGAQRERVESSSQIIKLFSDEGLDFVSNRG